MEDVRTVIGLSSGAGQFEGKDYDNVYIHCTYKNAKVNGLGVTVLKVRRTVFDENPVEIGSVFEESYDKYSRIKSLSLR